MSVPQCVLSCIPALVTFCRLTVRRGRRGLIVAVLTIKACYTNSYCTIDMILLFFEKYPRYSTALMMYCSTKFWTTRTMHVLPNLMPNESMSNYVLRRRPHNRELVNKTSRLVESSFINCKNAL